MLTMPVTSARALVLNPGEPFLPAWPAPVPASRPALRAQSTDTRSPSAPPEFGLTPPTAPLPWPFLNQLKCALASGPSRSTLGPGFLLPHFLSPPPTPSSILGWAWLPLQDAHLQSKSCTSSGASVRRQALEGQGPLKAVGSALSQWGLTFQK